ncbi:unnamed protein product [Haemonchus placei]|uniref:Thioredoxin-like_fold domain-containing protein n=1 Tax=Haemonchus placei TaxID=6290 RepID=A0A0N4W4R1_HAEPC|nr:unnamed protein product [Haemonchus placei]
MISKEKLQDFMKLIKTETSDNAMKLLLIIQKERPEKLEIATTLPRLSWSRIPRLRWIPGYVLPTWSVLEWLSSCTILASQAFGAPWIVVHKDGEEHPFFGSDRLHLIAHLIGQKFTDGLVQYSKL